MQKFSCRSWCWEEHVLHQNSASSSYRDVHCAKIEIMGTADTVVREDQVCREINCMS